MTDGYPFLVKDGDRQQVGISTPYYRELRERGYVEEGDPAPVELSSPEDDELTEEVKDSGDDQP